jgi:hypothetical protein
MILFFTENMLKMTKCFPSKEFLSSLWLMEKLVLTKKFYPFKIIK